MPLSDLVPQLVAGGLALIGVAVGAALNGRSTRRADERRLAAEDNRRWLADRRKVYASFLGLAHGLLEDLDGTGCFLSYDGTQPVSGEYEALIKEGLSDFHTRWTVELQPMLGEVQLLAGPDVAELADRVSAALMDLSGPVESRRSYLEFSPVWFAARQLVAEMLKEMRSELGVLARQVGDAGGGR